MPTREQVRSDELNTNRVYIERNNVHKTGSKENWRSNPRTLHIFFYKSKMENAPSCSQEPS
jgi:hypothetical protein